MYCLIHILFGLTFLFLLLPADVSSDTIVHEVSFGKYGHAKNGSCDAAPAGVCSGAALINSFMFLANKYPDVYGNTKIVHDTDRDGDIDLKDLRKLVADIAVNGWDADGQGPIPPRAGIYRRNHRDLFGLRDIWESKLDWIEDWAPGTTTLKGQVWKQSDIQQWRSKKLLDSKFPDWDFLLKEISHGEAVELIIVPMGQGRSGHAVTLTGVRLEDKDSMLTIAHSCFCWIQTRRTRNRNAPHSLRIGFYSQLVSPLSLSSFA